MKRKKLQRIIATAAAGVLAFTAAPLSANAAAKVMPDGYAFDASYYAENNPDVASAIGTDENALYQHYENYGKNEGRFAYDPDEEIVAENVNHELSAYLCKNVEELYRDCPSLQKIEYGFHSFVDNGSLNTGLVLGMETDSSNYELLGITPGVPVEVANAILTQFGFAYVDSRQYSSSLIANHFKLTDPEMDVVIMVNSKNTVMQVDVLLTGAINALYSSDNGTIISEDVRSSDGYVRNKSDGSLALGDWVWKLLGLDHAAKDLDDQTEQATGHKGSEEDLYLSQEEMDKQFEHAKNIYQSAENGDQQGVVSGFGDVTQEQIDKEIDKEIDEETNGLSGIFEKMFTWFQNRIPSESAQTKAYIGWNDDTITPVYRNKEVSSVVADSGENDVPTSQSNGIADLAKTIATGMGATVTVKAAESGNTDAVVSNKDLQNFLGKSVSTTSPFKEAQTLSTGALPQGFTFVGWDDNKNISEIAVNYESDPQAQYYFGNPALKVGTTFDSANSWLLKHGYSVVSEMTPFETVSDSTINLAKSRKWDYNGNTLYLEAQVYQKDNILVYIVLPSWSEDAPQLQAALAAEEEKQRQIDAELEQESNDYNGSQGISYGLNDCGDLSFIYEIRVAYANE